MEQQDRIMDGDLQTLGLQSILKMLALSGKTGKLLVYSGNETLSVSIRRGQIVALHEEGTPQPDLLGMLCLIGRLNQQHVQAIRTIAQGDMQITLALLVERGWMRAEEKQRRLEFAITQSLSHSLRWAKGRFGFHLLLPMDSTMEPLDIDAVLLEALRQADEWEEITRENKTLLTRTSVARWQPEVSRDVSSMGLSQQAIEVLCLCNGEIPLHAIAQVLMVPEARVAYLMEYLLRLNLIEVVDTALETELQRDLYNIIIKCQYNLAYQRQSSHAAQHLLGLITTLSGCINAILNHHSRYAKNLRGRGQLPASEVVRYLEHRFAQTHYQVQQHYPILETTTFAHGQLDCNDILTLNRLVKGEQLEEFYWEAAQGLAIFLRMLFEQLLHDEVGSSHTGRQLTVAWKTFLSEIDAELQRYHVYRAHKNAQMARDGGESGTSSSSASLLGIIPSRSGKSEFRKNRSEKEGNASWSSDTQRRSM